jgi:hypothetical protein
VFVKGVKEVTVKKIYINENFKLKKYEPGFELVFKNLS